MSPYLLLGFLFAGILKAYVPNEKYIGYIAKPNFRSILFATFAGIPLPLCSCGVIPTGISLHKEGASKGATISFLTATPQENVQSIMVTYSLLGLPFAIINPIVAIISGLTGGIIGNKLDKSMYKEEASKKPDCCSECEGNKNKKIKLLHALHYSFVEMLQDIGKWLVIGIVIAGLLFLFLPENLFSVYLNNPLLNMLIVLAIALPTYNCALGVIPVAAALMMKGLSPGAAFVLLMAGPATSIATMTVIGKALGKKSLLIYIINIVTNALLFGLVIDYILPASWFDISIINSALLSEVGTHEISILESICSIGLIGLIINAYIQKYLYSRKNKII